MTHGHLMAKEDPPPSCQTCGTRITVKHILIECIQYNEVRTKLKLPETLFEVLAPTSEASTILMKFIDKAELRPLI